MTEPERFAKCSDRQLARRNSQVFSARMQDPAVRAAELIAKIDDRTRQGRGGRAGLRRAAGRDARGRGRLAGGRLRRRAGAHRRARRGPVVRARTCPTSSSPPRSPPATGRPATPTTSRDFDVAVITVQTPLREASPISRSSSAAARDLAAWLAPGALVVLESTTYPGTTERAAAPDPRGVGPAGRRRRLLPAATRPSASTPATPSGRS